MSGIQLPASGLAAETLAEFKEQPGEFHLVTFNLGEIFGVPIHQVHEIVRVAGITRVPNSPLYMEGVINLRGRVLSVLNLRKRLGLPESALSRESRIIVTEIGSKVVGLLVDAVSHVIRITSDFVEPPPEEVLEANTGYITAVGRVNEKLIIMLDLERLLRRESIDLPEGVEIGRE